MEGLLPHLGCISNVATGHGSHFLHHHCVWSWWCRVQQTQQVQEKDKEQGWKEYEEDKEEQGEPRTHIWIGCANKCDVEEQEEG